MSAYNDGGPAFPNVLAAPTNDGYMSTSGMTLRDYFAAKAMAAMLGSDAILKLSDRIADSTDDFHRGGWIASQAYQFADAMLAARGAA